MSQSLYVCIMLEQMYFKLNVSTVVGTLVILPLIELVFGFTSSGQHELAATL